MLRLLADENFDHRILNGLRRRLNELDIVRVQDIPGFMGADDPAVLQWAADDERVVLTHDVATLTRFAYDRLRDGQPMPGVIEVHATAPIGRALEDLTLLVQLGNPEDLDGQIHYLPF